jgi:hypothetical protein
MTKKQYTCCFDDIGHDNRRKDTAGVAPRSTGKGFKDTAGGGKPKEETNTENEEDDAVFLDYTDLQRFVTAIAFKLKVLLLQHVN